MMLVNLCFSKAIWPLLFFFFFFFFFSKGASTCVVNWTDEDIVL